jgi:hypothetical protein
MSVEVHVERLVLHGVDPRDHAAVIEALRSELTRLFAQRAPAARAGRGDLEITIAGGGDPRELGVRAAAALHRELSR